jgi:hypothetical protein
MTVAYNIYCDESCNLEHDGQKAMVLGAVTCPVRKTREVAAHIRAIKVKHGLPPEFEVKWTKVSKAKLDFYLELVDYFFDERALAFRALVVPDKSMLDHAAFAQGHEDFYFKMYFDMLKVLLDPTCEYNIYIDIKDTRSGGKTARLREVLSNSLYDFERRIIQQIAIVRSEHVQQVQLADLLMGAVGYVHRGLCGNAGKVAIVNRLRQRSGYGLLHTTLFREQKLNLFVWHPAGRSFHG